MKFGKNLLRVIELSDCSWLPFWVNYKLLKKLIKKLPSIYPTGGPSVDEESDEDSGQTDETNLPSPTTESGLPHKTQQESAPIELPGIMEHPICGDSGQSAPSVPTNVLGRNPAEVTFFRFLNTELRKSIRFFGRTLDEFQIRVTRIHEGVKILKRSGVMMVTDRWRVLARASFKVYKDLVLLETYAIMTYCAFSKILKKHDKMTGLNTRSAFMKSMVSQANFSNTAQLQEMIRSVQLRYNDASCHLEKEGKANLQEDERLFLDLITQINGDTKAAADEEGAPMMETRPPSTGKTSRKRSVSECRAMAQTVDSNKANPECDIIEDDMELQSKRAKTL